MSTLSDKAKELIKNQPELLEEIQLEWQEIDKAQEAKAFMEYRNQYVVSEFKGSYIIFKGTKLALISFDELYSLFKVSK